MHCVPQTYLCEHPLENRKERGNRRDVLSYISLLAGTIPPPHVRSQPDVISPCKPHQPDSSILPWPCKGLPMLPASGGPRDPAAGACTSGVRSGLWQHPQNQPAWAGAARSSPRSRHTTIGTWGPGGCGQREAVAVSRSIDSGRDFGFCI